MSTLDNYSDLLNEALRSEYPNTRFFVQIDNERDGWRVIARKTIHGQSDLVEAGPIAAAEDGTRAAVEAMRAAAEQAAERMMQGAKQ